MKIHTTQQDIDVGRIHSHEQCPVSLAINRVLGNDYHAVVSDSLISIETTGGLHAHSMWTPKVAGNFIRAFDNNVKVHPFTFDLDIPGYLC